LESDDPRTGRIAAFLRPRPDVGCLHSPSRCALILVGLLACGPAAAQTVLQLDGTVNLNYTVTNPSPPDATELSVEVRPGITFQTGSSRLVFRISYLLAATFGIDPPYTNSYSNMLTGSLAAQPDDRSTLTFGFTLVQGGQAFQISQRPADTGQPAFRAEGNPEQLTGTLTQGFVWEAAPDLRLTQTLVGMLVAPQYNLSQSNTSLTGLVALDHLGTRDTLGGEVSVNVSRLRLSTVEAEPFWALITSLLGRWSHDFDLGWSTSLAAGVASVVTFTDTNPRAVVPTGNLTGRYFQGPAGASLSLDYGPRTDLQTGTVSQNFAATARGFLDFDPFFTRQLTASVGFLHSWPLGAVTESSAAGLGDAVQGDLGFLWGLSDALLATARYSIAYQFNQPAGVAPSMIHVFLVGVTARYSNAAYLPPMPTAGQRVDGTDNVPFPGVPARRP
jgi:hypothetical protein